MLARIASIAAAAAVVVMLSGCVAEPAPSPTPTSPFASEEEAFAAAEDTTRAYVDANNGVKDFDVWSFYAEYGDWPCSGWASVMGTKRAVPYTSLVDVCTTRSTPSSRAACTAFSVPLTLVST